MTPEVKSKRKNYADIILLLLYNLLLGVPMVELKETRGLGSLLMFIQIRYYKAEFQSMEAYGTALQD